MQVVAIVFETIHPPTWLKRESNGRGWMRGDALQGEKSVEIALLELSDGGGTQSRGKPRSKLALRTTLKRPSLHRRFTIPRCFIETGARLHGDFRDVNSANFVAETNPLPPYLPLHGYGIMVLCTAFVRVYIFTRYKTRGNYERGGIFENLELEGRGNEDDDRRANFLRGGKREKRREDGSGSLSSVNRC